MISPNQTQLGAHLQETYRMVHSAYSEGIPSECYHPMLALLSENMSQRALAELMAYCTGKDFARVFHDVLSVQSPFVPEKPEAAAVNQVKKRLEQFGYGDWLKQE